MQVIQIITYWIWELLKLHFYWIIYIFRGGVILGLFPSTAALYAVARRWVKGEKKEEPFRMYKQFYRENFKVANILGCIILFMSVDIYLNLMILPNIDMPILIVFMYGIIIFILIITSLFWIYLFPIIVNFSLPLYNYW